MRKLGKVLRKGLERKNRRKIMAIVLIIVLMISSVTIWPFLFPSQSQAATLDWGFDEGYSTTAGDTTGNSNSGTVNNAAWRTEDLCRTGKCLYFDGDGDYVTRADDADLDFAAADDFTITGWFKAGTASATQVIVAKYETTGGDGGYKVQMESDGDITCAIDDDNTFDPDDSASSTSADYDDSSWHHFACVKDGTTSLTLYLDGIQIAQDSSIAATGTLANDDAFYVGIDGDGASNDYKGLLDQIQIYSEVRTAAQISSELVSNPTDGGNAASFGSNNTSFLSNGLVGYWKLDEAGDATRVDSSGNGNDLTESTSDTVAQTGGQYGRSADFEKGDTEYLSIADASQTGLDLETNNFTFSWWMNVESDVGDYEGILGKSDGTELAYVVAVDGTDNQLRVYLDENGFAGGGVEIFTGSDVFSDATWEHFTLTYDGATIRLYVDGVEHTGGDFPYSTTIAIHQGSSAFYLGTWASQSGYFDGKLDEVRIYNRILSDSEIKSLYEWAPGPVGYWNFDENTSTTAYDRSTNGYDSDTFVNDVSYVPGVYGSAVNFDGTNDVIQIDDPTGSLVDLGTTTDSFTYEAWFRTDTNYAGAAAIVGKFANFSTYTLLYMTSSETVCMELYDGSNNPSSCTSGTYNDGEWHHVAGVRDVVDDNIYVYIDGVLQATLTDSTTGTVRNTDDISVGNSGVAPSYQQNDFNGDIDDVRIYNYARTQSQVVEDMNGGHPLGGSPIGSEVVYWKFDEGYGTTANDTIGNSNGTVDTNATWLLNNSCKMNGCLSFDAAGEEVAIATASDSNVDFNGSEPFSASAWIYVTTMPTSTSSDKDAIIAKWDDTNNLSAYRIYVENDDTDTTGNIEVQVYDESASQALTATSTTDGIAEDTWYHVLFTFNGGTAGAAGDLNLYVDGQNFSNSANGSFLGIEDLASDFTVGEYDTNDATSGNTAFTGYIDEVKVYAAELDADEALIDYNAGSNASFGVLGARESATLEDGDIPAPVFYYDLDENTGTSSVSDKSGNGNTLTMNGTMTSDDWVPGKKGSALDFDGSDDDLNTTSSNLADTDTMTFMAWIYPNTAGVNSFGRIFSLHDDGTNGTVDSPSFLIDDNFNTDSLRFEYEFTGTNGIWNSSNSVVSYNTWQHVAVTYDKSDANNDPIFYVNGVPVAIASETQPTLTARSMNGDIYIGNRVNRDREFDGRIDEVKMFDQVLTPAQIAYEFNRGAPVGWWKFDECSGSDANDSSGNSLTGTITPGSGTDPDNDATGSCSSGNGDEMWNDGTTGKRNGSLGFDGSDDYVSIADSDYLSFTDGSNTDRPFSIALWANYDALTSGRELVGKMDTSGEYVLGHAAASPQNLYFALNDNSANAFIGRIAPSSALSIGTDTWHHIVATYDGSESPDGMNIYIDGVERDTTDWTSGSYVGMENNGGTFTIGYADAWGGTNFDGRLDDVRVYNYELSATQVKNIMNHGTAFFGPATGSP